MQERISHHYDIYLKNYGKFSHLAGTNGISQKQERLQKSLKIWLTYFPIDLNHWYIDQSYLALEQQWKKDIRGKVIGDSKARGILSKKD